MRQPIKLNHLNCNIGLRNLTFFSIIYRHDTQMETLSSLQADTVRDMTARSYVYSGIPNVFLEYCTLQKCQRSKTLEFLLVPFWTRVNLDGQNLSSDDFRVPKLLAGFVGLLAAGGPCLVVRRNTQPAGKRRKSTGIHHKTSMYVFSREHHPAGGYLPDARLQPTWT